MKRNDDARRAVFVHGAGGGGWEWALWARVFAARGWSVLAPDLQPAADGVAATRWGDYREQVRQWCATPPDLLVGASLGGLLALAVAAAVQPRALVLVNPLPPCGLGRADACLHAPAGACVPAGGLSLTSWRAHMPAREPYPAVVPWGSARSLAATRRALPDADDATCLVAFRRWRDEAGAVLNAAMAGIDIAPPRCPVLIVASEKDDDVPAATSRALAQSLAADFQLLHRTSHVGPLLERSAAQSAQRVAEWSESRFTQHNPR